MAAGKPESDAVENLNVDQARFDAALKKLIETPPIRKAGVPKHKPWSSATPRGGKVSR